jgi:hypothetical protein
MKTVNISKAETVGTQKNESALILIDEEISADDHYKAVFENDAHELAETLYSVLPGGTFDRLVGYLLEKKESQLVVRSQ